MDHLELTDCCPICGHNLIIVDDESSPLNGEVICTHCEEFTTV